ncbi:MAG: 50S ribosomal protein L10 [Candidatus Bathyarchaeia archaeon]
MSTMMERPSRIRKAEEVRKLTDLIERFNVLGIANLQKVRAMQLQELSKKFRGQVLMKVAKNTILRRALEASKKQDVRALGDLITGSNILLLTNINPFKLSLMLDRNKVRMSAKAGDIAPDDIVIPAGNTGLPPGPAISELSELGVRTRIESGSVYVIQDTVVAKKGEPIQPRVASILSKLGIKPIEVGLSVVAAYENGLIFKSEDLHVDLQKIRKDFESAYTSAIALSVSTGFPTHDTMELILQHAKMNAYNLAITSGYPSTETMRPLLSKAYVDMVSLSKCVAKVNKEAAPLEFRE